MKRKSYRILIFVIIILLIHVPVGKSWYNEVQINKSEKEFIELCRTYLLDVVKAFEGEGNYSKEDYDSTVERINSAYADLCVKYNNEEEYALGMMMGYFQRDFIAHRDLIYEEISNSNDADSDKVFEIIKDLALEVEDYSSAAGEPLNQEYDEYMWHKGIL